MALFLGVCHSVMSVSCSLNSVIKSALSGPMNTKEKHECFRKTVHNKSSVFICTVQKKI